LPPEVPVLPVGGVTPENLAQWINAGCTGAGLGSDLYRAGQSVSVPNSRRHLLKRIERQCNENNQTHHVSFTPRWMFLKLKPMKALLAGANR
jgi:2-dehydro-3-deoxyphosphogalactonate aldolase